MARARTRNVNPNPIGRHYGLSDAQIFASKTPQFAPDVESKPSQAPTKGWDAISPISNMEPDYAVILDNSVPRTNWVEMRGGASTWASIGAPVETLMVYRPANSTEEMFAAAGGTIYNVTTFDTVTEASSGYDNDRWQYINFTPTLGDTYILAVNGEDLGQIYDGSTWDDLNVTGVTTSDLININAHKRRIWLIEKNSTRAWYLDTDAIAGAATAFDFGGLMTKGGHLIAMGSWTVDGGNGPDDLAVFVTSRGQAIVYKGTNPADSNAWFLVGTFNLPPPIGNRCLTSFGSDLLYISQEGLLPISKALPFDPSGVRSVALTNRIQGAMLSAAQNGLSLFGWEVVLFPTQSLLLMNVPVTQDVEQVQFVMNTLTGAWCRFTGWNGNCFAIFNDSLYYADNDGRVFLAYVGQSDGINPIMVDVKTAFNYYDDPGREKDIRMLRPYLTVGGSVTPQFGLDIDFSETDFQPTLSEYNPSGSIWDTAIWDESDWSVTGTFETQNDWQSIGGIGTAVSIRMKANIISSVMYEASLSTFDVGEFDQAVFDPGVPVYTRSGEDLPILRLNSFQVTMEHGAAVG